ncbi:SDR family oxidoreductase [Cellulomonas sp. P22]|uniref:SDR family oxidoreductase n=1 Tax=Cellulomonas sp. P22 TaxID=3373189 RepID=UPI0037B585D8
MRTIVVTGAASGIGRATKELLESRGDRVVGVDLHDADVTVDLSTTDGRTALVEGVGDLTGGKIDGIVANAGLSHEIPLTMAVNYFGAVATLEGLRPFLAGSDAPRAVTTSSMASLRQPDDLLVEAALAGDEAKAMARAVELTENGPKGFIYPSSKGALSRWLRRNAPTPEWAGAGIPLNAIAPGVVLTAMTADMLGTDKGRDMVSSNVPMPLNGYMPAESAAALFAWLVSPENTHLCGQVIFIDGGTDVVMRGDSTW